MFGQRIQSAFVVSAFAASVLGCKDTHHVVLRVEGNAECSPGIFATSNVNGDVKVEHVDYAVLPWEREFDPNIGELGGSVFASAPKCPQVQCQIIVDGKPVDIKADGKHVECKWTR